MKVGTVRLSTVTQHRRLDADFYLGESELKERELSVESARIRLENAGARYREALRRQVESQTRLREFIASGGLTNYLDTEQLPLDYVI